MHDLLIDPIWPVIPPYLPILGEFKRPSARPHGHLPRQLVAQHVLHHAAVLPLDLPVVGQVAAQVGRYAREQVQPVARNDITYLVPAEDMMVAVGRAKGWRCPWLMC